MKKKKFCKVCGSMVELEDLYCANCGSRIIWNPPVTVGSPTPRPEPRSDPANRPQRAEGAAGGSRDMRAAQESLDSRIRCLDDEWWKEFKEYRQIQIDYDRGRQPYCVGMAEWPGRSTRIEGQIEVLESELRTIMGWNDEEPNRWRFRRIKFEIRSLRRRRSHRKAYLDLLEFEYSRRWIPRVVGHTEYADIVRELDNRIRSYESLLQQGT